MTTKIETIKDFSRRAVMTLLVMMFAMTAQTVWAQTTQFPLYSGDEGTQSKPYQIKSSSDLIKLAADVNSGTKYEGKYFVLTKDISFSYSNPWNNSTEHNFDGIGNSMSNGFKGTFDGQNHTISGIRMHLEREYVGLFGYVENGTIKNVTLSDSRISGRNWTGGIVGSLKNRTAVVSNCHVTATVDIANDIVKDSWYHAGIVGQLSDATIENCTSSATISTKGGSCGYFAGIVGKAGGGQVKNNTAINVTVPAVSERGAILGAKSSSLRTNNNYYLNCNVAGTANATNVGCGGADITNNDGAVSIHRMTFNEGLSTSTNATIIISGINYYSQGLSVTLSGKASDSFSYTVNGDAIEGNTFNMPATDVVIGTAAPFSVTVNSAAGGSLVANPIGGKMGDVINMTATINSGYLLNGINVEDDSHNAVAVNGGEWYGNNTASFSMPGSNVTVTPVFTNTLTATNLSVNIPRKNNMSITIPSCVQSFKVYDHGGADGNYTNFCDGTLTLTAPDGYKLQLTGTMSTADIYDKLSVYDGTSTSATPLVENKTCNKDGVFIVTTSVGIITSSDKYMTIKFRSDSDGYSEGLDLTVTLIEANVERDINISSVAHGSVGKSAETAKMNETITLTASPESGYALGSLTVVDASGNAVDLEWSVFENTATFVMPGTAVTVTPVFVSKNPLSINIPRTGTVRATIPDDVVSFKVYDDGGANGVSSANNHGYLVLTAPANHVMRVSGLMRTSKLDILSAWSDSDPSSLAYLLRYHPEYDGIDNTIPTSITASNVLMLNYNSSAGGYSGLNLTIDVIPVLNLADNVNNTALITENDGKLFNVTLTGRTLFKDGNWNTLVLPFDLTLSGSTLDGAEARMMNDATITGSTLNITFSNPATTLEAGVPYIIKWSSGSNITNPAFKGVTINATASTVATSSDGNVTFTGTYSPVTNTDGLLFDAHNTDNKAFHAALSAKRDGYTFGGWFADASLTTPATSIPFGTDGSVTLYTKWVKQLSSTDITVADIAAQTYTGSAITPSVTVKDGSTTLTEGVDYTVAYSNNINASSSAKVIISGKGNYKDEIEKMFTINPASVTLTANSGTKTYTGSNQTVTGFTSSVAGLTFAGVSASGSGKNAGTYDVTFSGVTVNKTKDASGNYVVSGLTNGILTINPAAVTLTANSETKTYNGSTQSVTGFTSSVAELTFTGVSASGSGKNAGKYDVTFSGVTVNETKDASGNYVVSGLTNGILTINPKTHSGSYVPNIAAQTYTGSAITPSVTVEDGSETLTEGVDYTVAYSNNINASSSAKVIISGKGNYKDEIEKMFTINPASVTLTANSDTKTYNGSTQSVTGFTSSVAGLTFEGVSASGSGNNAGKYDVTFSGVTVNETKDASGNYVVTGLTNGILTINPAAVTVTADNKEKLSGTDDPEFTATVEGLFGNDAISYTLTREEGEAVGTYTITPAGEAEQGNYTITYVAGTLTINANTTPTAITNEAASTVKIFAKRNIIVVENAESAVYVYDVLGHEISSEPTPSERTEIRVNAGGIYIVNVGKVTKQLLVK